MRKTGKAHCLAPCAPPTNHKPLPEYSEGEWNIVSCTSCSFVYLHNPPGYEALIEEFAWEKTFTEEIKRRLKTRSISKRFSQATRWRLGLFGRTKAKLLSFFQTGNVLDIGCGEGGILLDVGGVPHGIEISKGLHQISHEKMQTQGGYLRARPRC